MLQSAKGLHGATLHAADGEIGHVDEFFFDDEHWTIRYLVITTGSWLFGRDVLISPIALGHADWERKTIEAHLTRSQVEHSPGVEMDKPVSRQWEADYYSYYAWPNYWGGMGPWGAGFYPGAIVSFFPGVMDGQQENDIAAPEAEVEKAHGKADVHLRSSKEVTGYDIHARDGYLGHVQDFLIDDETWAIRYLVVDTQNWWPGKRVLLPPRWIAAVNWLDRSVTVELSREQVRNAPEWDPQTPVSRAYEEQLYAYYEKQGYWIHEHLKETAS